MGERPPVLLVPGAFGQDWVYWNVMEYLLERDGHDVFTLTFPRLTLSDLRRSGELLREKVADVLDAEGHDRISLVAHSMGGLISRYYVKRLGGHETVRHLVCLGVPHAGTWTGMSIPVLRGTRQILPGSPFLNDLNAPDARDAVVPITNIYSSTDFIVFPPTSARLPEAPHVRNLSAPFAGHWGLLVSRRVYAWIQEALAPPPVASSPGGLAAAAGPDEARAERDARTA